MPRFDTHLSLVAALGLAGATAPAIGQTPAPPRAPATVQAPAPISGPMIPGPIPGPIPAQAPSGGAFPVEPERSVAVFGDWSMRCEGRPPARACEVTQTVQNDRAQPVAVFAMGRANRSEPMKLVVQLPLNIALRSTPRLVLEGGDTAGTPLALSWRQCVPAGCYADVELRDTGLLARLRSREQPGRLVFEQATGGEAQLPFSFRGLAAAMDAVPTD